MRGLVIFVLVVIAVVSFSFVVVSTKNVSDIKNEIKEESKVLEFSTFTSAVCENSEELVHCKDEVFVNCNGKISKVTDVAECNGIRLDVPKATGSAVFGKDWKDPRQ